MTVSVGKRTISVTDPTGTVVTLENDDKIAVKTLVTMVCDGPKCASRRDEETAVTILWVEEEVKNHPELLNNAFWRFIRMGVNPTNPKELSFCSAACAKDYLTYSYTEPKSYAEQMADIEKVAEDAKNLNAALRTP